MHLPVAIERDYGQIFHLILFRHVQLHDDRSALLKEGMDSIWALGFDC